MRKKGVFVIDELVGIPLLFASLFTKNPANYALIVANLHTAQNIYESLSSYLGSENILLFPNDDLIRIETLSSSKELTAQRLFVMNELLNNKPKILIVHGSSLSRYLPSPTLFKNTSFSLKVGQKINLQQLKVSLIKAGYQQVSKIDQSMQFASRGDILDIFSVNELSPVRIEFFDDEIESIRYFEISHQLSNEKINQINIIPSSDILFEDSELNNLKEKCEQQFNKESVLLNQNLAEQLKLTLDEQLSKIFDYRTSPQNYRFYGYAQKSHFSILDYAQFEFVFLVNKSDILKAEELYVLEAKRYLDELRKEGKSISGLELHQNLERLLKKQDNILQSKKYKEEKTDLEFRVRSIVSSSSSYKDVIPFIETFLNFDNQIVLVLNTNQQLDTIKTLLVEAKLEFETLKEIGIPNKKIALVIDNINEGFELLDEKLVVLTSKELFGYRSNRSRFVGRFKEATIIKSFEDLESGDYVVHEYNGIGRFVEIKTIETSGNKRDYLQIAYAGSDVLYIPLAQFHLIRKFVGKEGYAPKLNHLGGTSWEKTKKRIKERVNELAERLSELYKARLDIKGFAFSGDDETQFLFEQEFPYELTDDQKIALKEIKDDMEKDIVMDRLLCGDVGFGKTEVAFRAAYKAISNYKQVAILCPTTLLARQHFERATERFLNFGIRIAVLSRLVPEATQRKYIEQINNGEIDLVIGTHRLLSKDIKFKDLGLLIIDEEQRFGVEQKERIKEIKTSVDVLTLSATPIPRTLQMSLLGMRDLSQINTAPLERMPIQTYVTAFNEDVIKQLIERELSRGGQVFYIHNKIMSIYLRANRLHTLVPSAQIGVVHAQLNRNEIEDVMMNFYNGNLNLLVATSIIENGLDIANANLIIIEDADHFGLAQLYQIKGRVGRGNKIAYAYLFYKEYKTINEKALKRLKAIQDFAELGSGYKIAQRDLMIRGAGDILGPEQAGFIDSIGMDLYLKILKEAILEKKNEQIFDDLKPTQVFNIEAYIPEEYASDKDKIELYQEIEAAKNINDLEETKSKIRDIYGKIPSEVKKLVQQKRINILLNSVAIESIHEREKDLIITLSTRFSSLNSIGHFLFEKTVALLSRIKVTFTNRILVINLKKSNVWLDDLEELLTIINDLYNKHVEKKEIR